MFKKFIGWIYHKIYIDTKERGVVIRKGEVYWCALGENIGHEENGKGDDFRRPVLIFRKFNNNMFWGLPLSTKNKHNEYYVQIFLADIIQSVMISQLRTLDTKRLDTRMGYVSKSDFEKVRKAVIDLI